MQNHLTPSSGYLPLLFEGNLTFQNDEVYVGGDCFADELMVALAAVLGDDWHNIRTATDLGRCRVTVELLGRRQITAAPSGWADGYTLATS